VVFVTWLVRQLPVRAGNLSMALTEDLKLYALSNVSLGGNWRLIECDLTVSPPACTAKDTGVPVPSTDGNFNIRDVLIEDGFAYGCCTACGAMWWAQRHLTCYKFNLQTGEGAHYGDVNIDSYYVAIMLPQMVKIKEDVFLMKAKTDVVSLTLYRFKGSPSQITDRAHWEKIGTIINDQPIIMNCPDFRAANTECTLAWPVNERYLAIACGNRCINPEEHRDSFGLIIFDAFKEKPLGLDLSEIPFNRTSIDEAIRIKITEGRPAEPLGPHPSVTVIDLANKKAYGNVDFNVVGYDVWGYPRLVNVRHGILDVDLESRTAKFVERPNLVRVHGVTEDGRIIATEPGAVRLYDPQTGDLTNALTVPGLAPAPGQVCLNTEDVYRRVDTIIPSETHIVLPPNWQDGLRIPKRIEVTSPGEGQLRVKAEFPLVPLRVRIRLWRAYEQTVYWESTIPGAGIIDRVFTGLPPGKYRVEVTAL
jgi:hypothetical protein